mgnify:FL=1
MILVGDDDDDDDDDDDLGYYDPGRVLVSQLRVVAIVIFSISTATARPSRGVHGLPAL